MLNYQRVDFFLRANRLEFTNGGWCMHDEAAPHYVAFRRQGRYSAVVQWPRWDVYKEGFSQETLPEYILVYNYWYLPLCYRHGANISTI